MDTNLEFVFSAEQPQKNLQLVVSDRDGPLDQDVKLDGKHIIIKCKILLPNNANIKISGLDNPPLQLESCRLGGLLMSKAMIDQICIFYPDNGDRIVTPNWWTNGNVNIDFFSPDWVQYHLLYGNRIDFYNT